VTGHEQGGEKKASVMRRVTQSATKSLVVRETKAICEPRTREKQEGFRLKEGANLKRQRGK